MQYIKYITTGYKLLIFFVKTKFELLSEHRGRLATETDKLPTQSDQVHTES